MPWMTRGDSSTMQSIPTDDGDALVEQQPGESMAMEQRRHVDVMTVSSSDSLDASTTGTSISMSPLQLPVAARKQRRWSIVRRNLGKIASAKENGGWNLQLLDQNTLSAGRPFGQCLRIILLLALFLCAIGITVYQWQLWYASNRDSIFFLTDKVCEWQNKGRCLYTEICVDDVIMLCIILSADASVRGLDRVGGRKPPERRSCGCEVQCVLT